MSRYEDKWLDICTLLRQLQAAGKVLIVPAENKTDIRQLGFCISGSFSGNAAASLIDVLQLADRFEFSADGGNIKATVFVDLSATS